MSEYCESNLKKGFGLRVIARSDFFLIAGAVAVISGLTIPVSAHVFDVLLIFCASLTVALVAITFSARGVTDISGFPLLIALVTVLRTALSITFSKLIFFDGDCGTIAGWVGSIVAGENSTLTILVFCTLTGIAFAIICKAVRTIARATTEFSTSVMAIKQSSIDNYLSERLISKAQGQQMQEELAHEAGFFTAMAGAARLVLCAAVIESAIIIFNILASIATGTAASRTTDISLKTGTILALGAGMIIQTSSLLVALVAAYIVRKSSLSNTGEDDVIEQQKTAKKIKVVARSADSETDGSTTKVQSAEVIELQNDNFASYTERAERFEQEFIFSDKPSEGNRNSACGASMRFGDKVIAEDLEWLDDEQEMENNTNLWVYEEIKGGDYYESIAELIACKYAGRNKTVLMAAEGVERLGVTVPVNIAMRLVKQKKRCLLIDFDLQRSAVSKVFDIDQSVSGKTDDCEAVATCIKNLWIVPAGRVCESGGMRSADNLAEAMTKLAESYDHIIVYAPDIRLSDEWGKFAKIVNTVMLFGRTDKNENSSILVEFQKVLIGSGCNILGRSEILAGAVV